MPSAVATALGAVPTIHPYHWTCRAFAKVFDARRCKIDTAVQAISADKHSAWLIRIVDGRLEARPPSQARCLTSATHQLMWLHYFAHENVKLSVFLFAHFGDFVGAHLIAAYFRALLRRGIPGWEFNDDTRGGARTKMKHFVC